MQAQHVHPGHNPPLIPNGHAVHNNQNGPVQNQQPSVHQNPSQQPPKEPITVLSISSVTMQNSKHVIAGSHSSKYTFRFLSFPLLTPRKGKPFASGL